MGKELSTLKERVTFRVGEEHSGGRLDSFLAENMPWRTRSSIQKLIRGGSVIMDSRSPKSSRKVFEGESIEVILPTPIRDRELSATEVELDILYEDEDIVALNKPPGIPVHPSGRLLYKTIISSLHMAYRNPIDGKQDVVPKLCHRLDLETSGLLLVGKNDAAVAFIQQQFEKRETKKTYLAIVYGHPSPEAGEVNLPIELAGNSPVYQKMGIRHDIGRSAITRYRVLEPLRDYSLVEVELLTGRRHQIRVHLAHLGYPVVGDKLYGPDEQYFLMYYDGNLTDEALEDLVLPRQALHSHRITFQHPKLGEMTLEAPLFEDLQELIRKNRMS